MIEALCRRDCVHIKEDKNECRLLPDCPIRIPTLMSPEDQRNRNIEKKYIKYDKCLFPKCRSKMRINGYCAFHNEVVTNRRELGWPDEMLHYPIKPHKCKMEGCDNETDKDVCYAHRKTIRNRTRAGVPEDKMYLRTIRTRKKIPPKKCEVCGALYEKKPNVSIKIFQKRRYCSPECSQAAQRGAKLSAR
jgi:hypothetical protein